MLKVFISQPMSGRSEEDIIKERLEEMGKIRMYLGNDVIILDTYMTNDYVALLREENARRNNCMWADGNEYVFMLGSSITAMAKADVVWFTYGSQESTGCMYEWSIACQANMRRITQDANGKIYDSEKENE